MSTWRRLGLAAEPVRGTGGSTRALAGYVALVRRLGPASVAAVACYRLILRSGLLRWLMPIRQPSPAALLAVDTDSPGPAAVSTRAMPADRQLEGQVQYFGRHWQPVGSPPDWFLNPFNGARHRRTKDHWSRLPDFDAALGDIKVLWDLSRGAWALEFARAFRASGDVRYLEALRRWLDDWRENNPANAGPNWKCGQEAAIRLLHLLLALRLSGGRLSAREGFVAMARDHCRRISATAAYAVAQRNNHAVVEAVALWVGGGWLLTQGGAAAQRLQARCWQRRGRRLLEYGVGRLIAEDGSFAQHSTGYHRLVLDVLAQAELWRRWLAQPPFSKRFGRLSGAAVEWLYRLTDEGSGDAPNLGANDGSHVLRLGDSAYRDFRPSVQLAAVLFLGRPVYPPGAWDPPWDWLGLHVPSPAPPARVSHLFAEGGYALLRGNRSWGLVRLARRRFRPAHADALHLDLWLDGRNLLRDGGSFSYAAGQPWYDYFPGVTSHNTVQFGEDQPMPRLGRFLFGAWLLTTEERGVEADVEGASFGALCADRLGAMHRRGVRVRDDRWQISDEIDGGHRTAVLRWRLTPEAEWRLAGRGCYSRLASILIATDSTGFELVLTSGFESRHYLERTPLPVLEIRLGSGRHRVLTRIEPGPS